MHTKIKKKDCNSDFSVLDLKHIEERFDFQDVRLLGDKIYITSKQQDEWYIEYDFDINTLLLFHKNKKHDTKNYHKEKKRFKNIFQIFGYVKHHENKVFDDRRYGYKRLEELFSQIENKEKVTYNFCRDGGW